MFFFGFGPVFKAVIAVLKGRIKAAEEKHRKHKMELQARLEQDIKRLEALKVTQEALHLEQVTAEILKGV